MDGLFAKIVARQVQSLMILFPYCSERSEAWYRASFGLRRSWVRIPPLRQKRDFLSPFCLGEYGVMVAQDPSKVLVRVRISLLAHMMTALSRHFLFNDATVV